MDSYYILARTTQVLHIVLFHYFSHVSSRSSTTPEGGRVDLFSLSIIVGIVYRLSYVHLYYVSSRSV